MRNNSRGKNNNPKNLNTEKEDETYEKKEENLDLYKLLNVGKNATKEEIV